MGHDGSGKLSDGKHAAFHMHMRITETGASIAARRVNHFGFGANGVGGIGAHISKAAMDDGDRCGGDDFAGMDIHPFGIGDDSFSGQATSGNGYKIREAIVPRFYGVHRSTIQ